MSKKELDLAVKAAIEAGKEILAIYNQENIEVETKGDNSPLTKADKKAHAVISKMLSDTNIPLLSEEGKEIPYHQRSGWDRFWLVDPLDGTKEFVSRNGEFTVNIALIEDNEPVIGVVYVPVLDELFFGSKGYGGFQLVGASNYSENISMTMEKAIALPKEHRSEVYKVVGSRSHMNKQTSAYIDGLRKMHPKLEIVQRGSSLKICMVASGEADIYPRFGPTMEWDTAAGHAIMNAVGKKLYEPNSLMELSYNKENLLNPYFIVE